MLRSISETRLCVSSCAGAIDQGKQHLTLLRVRCTHDAALDDAAVRGDDLLDQASGQSMGCEVGEVVIPGTDVDIWLVNLAESPVSKQSPLLRNRFQEAF